MEKKPYTIDDVAKELGVSKTTVSRALSGKGRVGRETTERIQNYIAQHDFNLNVMARGLAQKKTYNLAMVLPADYMQREVAFFKECLGGICRVASAHDYDLSLAMEDGQLERMIANHKVDGVFLSRAVENDPAPGWLNEKKVPFVVIGTPAHVECSFLDNQNREAGRELTSLLLRQDARSPVLLGGDTRYQVTAIRSRGFLDACADFGIAGAEARIYPDLENYSSVQTAISQALATGADTFICMDDYICNLAMQVFYERHLAVPEQIWVASMYDNFLLEYHNPPVTAVRFDTDRLGARACAMLLRKLGEPLKEEADSEENYRVILRKSTGRFRHV